MKLRILLLLGLLGLSHFNLASQRVIDSLYQIGADTADGSFFRQMGKDLEKEHRLNDAISAYEEAYRLFLEAGDSMGMAKVLNTWGLAMRKKDKPKAAINSFLKAATINQDIKYDKGLADNFMNLGNFYASHALPSQAYPYFLDSYKLYKRANNEKMMYGLSISIGTLFYEEGFEKYDLDSAEYYLQTAYEGFEEMGIYNPLPGIKQNFGMIHEIRGDYGTALSNYREAREGFKRLGDDYNYMKVTLNLGNTHLKIKKPREALNYFREGMEMARKGEIESLYLDFMEQSIRAFMMAGDYRKLPDYFDEYDSLKEHLANEENIQTITKMDARYQNELKEQEIKTQEARIAREVEEKKMTLLALLVVLILTILIIVFYNQRQKALRQLGDKRTKLHHQEINRMLQDHELERMNAMISGQERERHRIATDLHDRLGSTLSAVKLHMNAFESMHADGPAVHMEQRERLSELLDRAVNEVREISHDMLSGVLTKFGLAAALQDLKETLESSGQYRVHLQIMNVHNRLDNSLELHLYRIVQELVSNILKHADATMITIQVNKLEDEIILMVEDDGIGFSPDTGSGDGVGLQNVADRVKSLNGHLHVDAQPGRGATITVEIPTP